MIHIDRSPSGFTVSTRSSDSVDHENLSSTGRQTFSRIAGAWTNIKAHMKEWNSEYIDVQDNTGKSPVVSRFHRSGRMETSTRIPELTKKMTRKAKPKKKAAKKSFKTRRKIKY